MISKKLFLVYFKFNGKPSNKPAIISPTLEDAKNYCRGMKKSSRDYDIISTDMIIGIHRRPCTKTDPANHIPFDLNKTAYPIQCDICASTAVYFCNVHSSVYVLSMSQNMMVAVQNLTQKQTFLYPNLQLESVKTFCLCFS